MKHPWSRGSLFEPRRRGGRRQGGWGRAILLVILAGLAVWIVRDRIRFGYEMYTGKRAVDRGDFRSAKGAFQRAWRINPDSPLVYDCAGFLALHENAKDWRESARGKYAKAREMGMRGNFFINHVKEARRLLDAGQYERAEVEIEHTLAIAPRNAQANLLLGHLLFVQEKLPKALEQYQKALTLSPGDAEIQATIRRTQESKTKGSIPYIFDREGQPLAMLDVASGQPIYPSDFWMAHLIGYRSALHGMAGLEAALGDRLRGNKLTLTIDSRLQRIADAALGWQKGAIVVLDPRSGEILACVSHPSFRPSLIDKSWRKIKDNPNNPLKNRAMESLYEPGSIAKIITAAAITETRTNISKLFPFKCRGYMMIGRETFWDWRRHNTVNSFADAFNQSCNVGMARMVPQLGSASLIQYLRAFGFGETDRIELELPVTPSRAPLDLEAPMTLASTAIGLGKGFRITPLHAAMIAAMIANNGVMMAPVLVKEMRSVTDAMISEHKPRIWKTSMKKETAQELNKYMAGFVQDGIGKKARMIRHTVAGKTGTSGSSAHGLNGWFICFAPANNPTLAVAILCENGGSGHTVATPIAQKLIGEALR